MEPQPLTPEQKVKVKKAKLILWLGLGAIMLIGLLIVFYFVFVNKVVAPTVKTNTTVNTATGPALALTIDELLKDPPAYNGQNVCLTGWYSFGFESTVMVPVSHVLTLDDGRKQIDHLGWRSYTVWVDVAVPGIDAVCSQSVSNSNTTGSCILEEKSVCGVFKIAAMNNTAGYGHLGAYPYALQ
jgi:hypothetical protein